MSDNCGAALAAIGSALAITVAALVRLSRRLDAMQQRQQEQDDDSPGMSRDRFSSPHRKRRRRRKPKIEDEPQ